jgi:sulfate adenylyltransferase subunit 1 (EFTu-like GTPase family)
VLPSGRQTRVRSIVAREGELAEAFAPMSVTVCLDDEVDVSRGDMLVAPDDPPAPVLRFAATLVWMNEKPAAADRPYLLKHTTQTLAARIVEIRHRVDIHTLAAQAAGELRLNEIGSVLVEAQRPLFVDPYRRNRVTGSFILLDPLTNETVGAGMIESAVAQSMGDAPRSASIRIEDNPDVLWLLARRLVENGHRVVVLSNQLLQVGPAGAASAVELSFTSANLVDRSGRAVDQILQELAHCGVVAQN